jgi:hypothetical protein
MRWWLVFLVGACAPATGNVRQQAPQHEPPAVRPQRAAPASSSAFGFWLVADETWHSTLYWLADGRVNEGPTTATEGAPDVEPTGTLVWVGGCGGTECNLSCPLRGTLEPGSARGLARCEARRILVKSRCSDGRERTVRLELDGRCDDDQGPRAVVMVEGEPVSDGSLPGWQPISARYMPCGSLAHCGLDVARRATSPRWTL